MQGREEKEHVDYEDEDDEFADGFQWFLQGGKYQDGVDNSQKDKYFVYLFLDYYCFTIS